MKQLNPRSVSLRAIAGLVAGMGVINLLSAVTPSLPSRVLWIEQIFPIEVRHSAHFFTALSGFWLLLLAFGLLRRKRVAWLFTVALLTLSIVLHLVKGLDVEEGLVGIAVLAFLITTRKAYTARSDPPSIAQGAATLLASGIFTLAYGTAGFLLMDRLDGAKLDLPGAALQTLLIFFAQDNVSVAATTRFARFFIGSIDWVGGITLLYAFWMLLRPMLLRGEPASTEQHEHAKAIVAAYGMSAIAPMTLLSDKAYLFSPSGQSMIAFVAKGRGAVALGDPLGPSHETAALIQGFQDLCRLNDWTPGFYQTQPDLLPLYEQLGFRAIKIGEEAVVDLKAFTLTGKSGQDLRTARNRLAKLGHQISFHEPPLAPGLLDELKLVSDEWLRQKKGSEKKFSVGWFEEAYVMKTPVAVVRTADGRISAFANLVAATPAKAIGIDLMRHRADMVNGTMDFLFISLFQYGQDKGYERFYLGLSALSGVGERTKSARMERVLHYLYEHLNRFYNFKGLHAYKEKFKPTWEPRYLVFAGYTSLIDVVAALIRADSGDRLIDYLKPDG